jgi:hypothetical protein
MDKNSIRPWDANGSLFLWEQKSIYHCVKKNQAVREKITGKRRMDDTGPSRHQGAF